LRNMIIIPALLSLAACANSYAGANAGSGDNHPAVCQEQSDLARNGLTTGGQISIACPDHGIGQRLSDSNRGPLPQN
jgi:hypothetical protein